MEIIHTNLLICVLYQDTANSSDFGMSNKWLISDKLIGEGNIMAVFFRLDAQS